MKLLDRRERIEAAGGVVVAVAGDEPERVRAGMLRDLEVGYPVPYDPQHHVYRAWGLGRASWPRTYLAPEVVRGYGNLLRRGERLARPGRDVRQLGGDFVIAPDGMLTFSHPQAGPEDRPPAGLLVKELERAGSA